MPTLVAQAGNGGGTGNDGLFPQPTTPIATPAGEPTSIEILSLEYPDNDAVFYPSARLVSIEWTLNGWETAEIEIPLDVDVDDLPLANPATIPLREVQVWRNGHLLFWGLPTDRRVDSDRRVWRYTARGWLWPLSRRHIGKASRTDLLHGIGNFEGTDLVDFWNVAGSGLTQTAVTTIKLLDAQSARLVTTASALPRYLYAGFVQESTAIGLAVFLTAWVFVESMVSPPPDNVGIWLGIGPNPDSTGRFETATIDSGTVLNGWRRLSCVASLLPDEIASVEVRLYGLGEGTLYWDAVTVTVLESLSMIAANSPGGTGWDQISIAHEVVKDLQGVSGFSTTLGVHNQKSNLNIGVAGALSGVIKERTYQHADHPRGYGGGASVGILDDFAAAADGFDFRVDLAPGVRTFRTYYPRIGVDRTLANDDRVELVWDRRVHTDGTLLVEPSLIVVSWDYGESIVSSANQVVELGGWGTGAGREEGGYENNGSLSGMTLELVEGAPNETPIDQLDAVAEERGAQLERPIVAPTFVCREPRDPVTQEILQTLIGVLLPGDVVPLRIHDGGLDLDGNYRVVRVRYDHASETLAVTPNPEPL